LQATDGIPLPADRIGGPSHLVVEIRGEPHGVRSMWYGIVAPPRCVPLLLEWMS
jgi:hypothetical protein